ncbi:MAG: hypothetical protein AB1792_03405 [Candidatus Zixiibacteriota bacterium]
MVRPVELQDNLAKTPAAERIAQTQRAAPENDQRQAMMTVTQKAQVAQRKPTAPEQSDEVIIHREQDDRQQERKKNKGREPDRPGDGETEPETKETTPEGKHQQPPDPASIHLDVQV